MDYAELNAFGDAVRPGYFWEKSPKNIMASVNESGTTCRRDI
jgi:hypothetical protein